MARNSRSCGSALRRGFRLGDLVSCGTRSRPAPPWSRASGHPRGWSRGCLRPWATASWSIGLACSTHMVPLLLASAALTNGMSGKLSCGLTSPTNGPLLVACFARRPTLLAILTGPATFARLASSESDHRLHPKCSACTLAARTPAPQTWTSSHWLLPKRALLSKACRTPRSSSLCSGAASTTLKPHTCCAAMVTAWTQAACSALTRAWRRDWPLHSVTTSRMTVGRRLFRLTQADLACEKRAPSLCRPSWQVGSPLAPVVAEMCQHTAVCALLRFFCRPTTPVPLQHGPCGCKGSRMLCMTKLVSSWLTPATWHSGAGTASFGDASPSRRQPEAPQPWPPAGDSSPPWAQRTSSTLTHALHMVLWPSSMQWLTRLADRCVAACQPHEQAACSGAVRRPPPPSVQLLWCRRPAV